MFTQAKLIVRKPDKSIVHFLDVTLDESSVREQVKDLRSRYPSDFDIDTSQIEAARAANQRSRVA